MSERKELNIKFCIVNVYIRFTLSPNVRYTIMFCFDVGDKRENDNLSYECFLHSTRLIIFINFLFQIPVVVTAVYIV